MIDAAILTVMALLLALAIHARRSYVRARRQRESMRHVTGIEEWWGKR